MPTKKIEISEIHFPDASVLKSIANTDTISVKKSQKK